MIGKIIAYPVSVIYYLFFGFCLCLFHIIQVIALNLFGHDAHKRSVEWFVFFLLAGLRLLGTRINMKYDNSAPENVPLIIVSNHQSMYDILLFVWYLKKHNPKFISKKALGKWIPSVSYNLRHGGSILIDRSNSKSSLEKIKIFAEKLEKNKWSVVIFPEGTRSRTGIPKEFHRGGLSMLIKNMPSSYILPVSINNSWEFRKYNHFPIPLGVRLGFQVHSPIKVNGRDPLGLISEVEHLIHKNIKTKVS